MGEAVHRAIELVMSEGLVDDSLSTDVEKDEPWPEKFRWVACYVVTGDSEGHYIHVDLIDGYHGGQGMHGEVVRHLITGKTFDGRAAGQRLASRLAELFGV